MIRKMPLIFVLAAFACGDKDGGDDTGAAGDDTGAAGDDTGAAGDDTGAAGDDTGSSFVDADEDGWPEEVDCDDNDASINPDAEEIAGDGIDQDCDGEDLSLTFTDLDWRLHDDIESLVYVSWSQPVDADVHVEYSFDDGEWHSTPTLTAAAGAHQQLVVGIPYETDAEWRVVSDDGAMSTDGAAISTGEIPGNFPAPTLDSIDESQIYSDGEYLLSSINASQGGWTGGDFWTFIMDREARIVWAQVAPQRHWTLFVQVSVTGDHFLWDEATYWSTDYTGAGSTVHRTYLDQEIEEIDTPGLHHAFVEMPDGTLAWGSQNHGGGETLAKKGPDDTEETLLWTCSGSWPGVGGYCESNGIFYSEDRDSFLYSFYTNSSIVEVDNSTGESLWWAGTVSNGYDFDPAESQVDWQHGITYTETGSLLISTDGRDSGRETTLVREYDVDHDERLLTEIWKADSGVLAGTNGDAWRLPNGNTLHGVGSSGNVVEYNAKGEDIWRVTFGNRLLGRVEFIEDLYTLVSPDASF